MARRGTALRAAGRLLVAACLVLTALPGDAAPRRTVSGWLPYWATSASYEHFAANADLFRAVSPFWYRADGVTAIYSHPGAGDARVVNGARSKRVPVVPTITETMPAREMSEILGSSKRYAHEDAIVRLVMSRGYDGIDVDYEQFAVTRDAAVASKNRLGFTGFVRGLCAKLRSRGKQCVVTVMPRTDDAMQASYRTTHSVGVFDYAAIAQAATTMRIMTYGHHYPSGTPGPVAGYQWVEAVARYTVSKVGANKSKVEMGLAQFGYDWGRPGVRAATYTYAQAVAKMRAVGAKRQWSSTEQAPYFTYRSSDGVAHTVWYDDAISGGVRAKRFRDYGFAGTALWYPGVEDSRLWMPLRELASS